MSRDQPDGPNIPSRCCDSRVRKKKKKNHVSRSPTRNPVIVTAVSENTGAPIYEGGGTGGRASTQMKQPKGSRVVAYRSWRDLRIVKYFRGRMRGLETSKGTESKIARLNLFQVRFERVELRRGRNPKLPSCLSQEGRTRISHQTRKEGSYAGRLTVTGTGRPAGCCVNWEMKKGEFPF